MKAFDVVIVGGGIVGASLACALAQCTPLSIAIIEAKSRTFMPFLTTDYHHRVSAITLASRRIFQHLKIWDAMCDKRISPFTQIKVWDGETNGEIQFCSEDITEPMLGYIIENNVIELALQEKINQQREQIAWLAPLKLMSVAEDEKQIEFRTADGEIIVAKLAIAADGAQSWLREQLKFTVKSHDYEQQAIVASVETTLPHGKIARQVFLNSGPLAFLPLADENISSIVWSLASSDAQQLLAMDDRGFKLKLSEKFSYRLGDVVNCSKRFAFPLQKLQTDGYIKPRVALVGDAAHTVHPLAGLGFNMGLLDAACLVEVITRALKLRRDFAALDTLRRYERWRKADNFTLMAGIDMIKQLFASDKKTVQLARSFGLNTTNRLAILRNFLTRFAVGNRSGLPTLALGEANEYDL